MRVPAGTTKPRSTGVGIPEASRNDTSASPTPSAVIASRTSRPGFGRNVSAAVATAFWSRGVKARSACCTRLPSWPEHRVRHVERVLGDEVDAHALRADQPHDLLDLVEQAPSGRRRRAGAPRRRRTRAWASPGRRPRGASRTARRAARAGTWRRASARLHQPVGGEDVDHAPPGAVGAHQVVQVERRLAEERLAALLLEHEERPLDRPDAGRGDVAVFGRERLGVVARRTARSALQVLEVEQQQPVVVGDLEGDVSTPSCVSLRSRMRASSSGPISRHRGAERVALLAEHVPERHGQRLRRRTRRRGRAAPPARRRLRVGRVAGGRPGRRGRPSRRPGTPARRARLNPSARRLQGDGLARAGGPGDQAVAVGELGQQGEVGTGGGAGHEDRFGHGRGGRGRQR